MADTRGWRTMETAPRDGTVIIVRRNRRGKGRKVFWRSYYYGQYGYWECYRTDETIDLPTQWKPLPPLPAPPGR